MKYTWDDIFNRAIDKAWFEPELRAKDHAAVEEEKIVTIDFV